MRRSALVQQAAHADDPEAVPADVAYPDVWPVPATGGRAEVGGDVVGAGGELGLQAREDERHLAAGPAEQRARPEPHVVAAVPGAALGDRAPGQGEPSGGRLHDGRPDRAGVGVRPDGVEPGGAHGRVVGAEESGEAVEVTGREQEYALGLADPGGAARRLGGERTRGTRRPPPAWPCGRLRRRQSLLGLHRCQLFQSVQPVQQLQLSRPSRRSRQAPDVPEVPEVPVSPGARSVPAPRQTLGAR